MHKAEEPIVEEITSSEAKNGDYVRITFKPDFDKLNMDGLDEDAVGLLSKRAYDVSERSDCSIIYVYLLGVPQIHTNECSHLF